MSEIIDIYSKLEKQFSCENNFLPVEKLFHSKNFYVGISEEKMPMFLIEHEFKNEIIDFNLKHISIVSNKKCNVRDEQNNFFKICTVIVLKNIEYKCQKYFLEVMYTMLNQIPENINSSDLKNEINKIVQLFSSLSHPSIKTIQGLWAELFLILQSTNPEYLLKSWHSTPESKFDFNDGKDKIEVKSSSAVKRIHAFTLEQLNPNKNSKLIIASVITIQTGIGKNLNDLRNMISDKTKNFQLMNLVDTIIFKTLGSDINDSFETYFDFQTACDTLKFYNFEKIPKIKQENIPQEISSVKFNCDLTNAENIEKNEINKIASVLFRSL